jgi:hypothetical protein
MRKVFFDESGNTGQNLIDEADPIFVLGSCSFQVDEEEEVLSHFQQFKGPELKFSRLRKTAAGQKAVLAFLASAQITSTTVAAFVIHKPFMVVTKYCDLVLEPSFRNAGVDFYKRGMNLATANILTTMPVLLNPTTWSNFLSLFVRVLRERTPSLFNEWQRLAKLIFAHLEHTEPESADFFAPVFLMSDSSELFEGLGDNELDPLVPAYYVIVDHWGKSVGEVYDVVADESNVLAKARGRLLTLSDPNLKAVSVGYDRRKMDFPLKVSEIVTVDSTAYRQIQFADVLCGAIASAAKAQTKGALRSGTFAHDVLELCYSKGLIIGGLWPNHEVDPKDLETDIVPGPNDVNLPTYTAMILKGHPSTKKTHNE